ncbi:MAG TPA: DUF3604 domain-containing protein [Acidimicrobiales bacterium]|nr:DUF3604 domain-containing protein [Acidimicrobiales bacterium]
MHECDGRDHRLETYAAADRRLLAQLEEFDRALVEAMDSGVDVSAVFAALDPDPARYTWVDEGGGLLGTLLKDAEKLLAEAPRLAGHRLLPSAALPASRPAARPSIGRAPDGTFIVAWLEWSAGEGDQVVAVRTDDLGRPLEQARVVPGEPSDCLRPSVGFDGDGVAFVFFGLRRGGAVGVYRSQLAKGGWQAPELASSTGHPSFNQEITRHADGSLECCWQGYRRGRFEIFSSRQGAAGAWSEAELLSEQGDGERNVWDPAVAASSEGGVAYAWTSYGAGGYETAVLLRRRGGPDVRHRIEAAGAYSLHPSLAFTPDGTLWCADDCIALGAHGGSGPTRLVERGRLGAPRRRGVRPDGLAVPGDLAPEVAARVRVSRLAPDGFEDTGAVGGSLRVSPAGLPRLAVTAEGSLAVAYRCVRQLPLMLYYWETVAERWGAQGWEGRFFFQGGDGPLEEPAVAGGQSDVLVAWQEDGRRARGLTWTEGFGGEECLRRRQHYGEVVWHSVHEGGRVRLARLHLQVPAGGSAGTRSTVVRAAEPASADARPWAAHGRRPAHERYVTEVGASSYGLYWGDLHRHSLISRCTAGDEPELDDFYRYSFDVCEYDFWAVTDHAENTSPYQWWSIQKLADVLHVEGRFVPFYGFEWTSATGHQNVIYESLTRGAPIYSSTAAETSNPRQLWDHLKQTGLASLTIPHHPGSAMVAFDWSYRDEAMLRLVEIFQSCRGNYEADGCFRQYSDGTLAGTFATDGLRAGNRFGLIASSDHGNGASYVGAYAEELSRSSVFAALHARRTIAATTRDLVVDFRLNDRFMGGAAAACDTASIAAYARGYRDIARIDLVRNAAVARSWATPLELPPGWIAVPLRVEWVIGSQLRSDWSGRLVVTGGEILETEYWSPEVVHVERDRVSWVASTRNFHSQYGAQRGGVELTVVGPPEAELEVTTATLSGRARLGDLGTAGRVELGAGDAGVLGLQPGTGGLTSLGTNEMRVSFEEPVLAPSWYYLRVTLIDGEMAWSSPVWVAPPAGLA